MPIDPRKAAGGKIPKTESSWTHDDVILYHLGVGAGMEKPVDPRELEYTYEKTLKVLPSFAVFPVFTSLMNMTAVPGLDINLALVLHGEHAIEIHKPIPLTAEVVSEGRIADLYDKGKAAVIVIDVETREKSTGDKLFTNRSFAFARGEGGFGGDSGPKARNQPPDRKPDVVTESRTLPQQALIYRLSGDKNPLHADPEFSKMVGYDAPILHGLCSYGMVCKAAVDELLDGAVEKVVGYTARFASVVYPGETIVTSMWKEADKILISAKTRERDTPVLSNSAITLRS